jgi:hypothetical protein
MRRGEHKLGVEPFCFNLPRSDSAPVHLALDSDHFALKEFDGSPHGFGFSSKQTSLDLTLSKSPCAENRKDAARNGREGAKSKSRRENNSYSGGDDASNYEYAVLGEAFAKDVVASIGMGQLFLNLM